MRIAFDAKRAFFNHTGLGNYARLLISNMSAKHPQDNYLLFTPKLPNKLYTSIQDAHNVSIQTPYRFWDKQIPPIWRISGILQDLRERRVDVFHGLSNELPFGIQKLRLKKIVTIHDLIFLRYPHFYNPIDRQIYTQKSKFACYHADVIIAISEQTKSDIVKFFKTDPKKIVVIYQDCDPSFHQYQTVTKLQAFQKKYKLPAQSILCVSSISERKNQLLLIKSYHKIKDQINMPLLIVGQGKGAYYNKIMSYVQQHNLEKDVLFYPKIDFKEFPLLYRQANVFVYPSVFEGFGIPVLEAMNACVPVITTAETTMQEIGGDTVCYFDGKSEDELANKLLFLIKNQEFANKLIQNAVTRAKLFRVENMIKQLYQVYQEN